MCVVLIFINGLRSQKLHGETPFLDFYEKYTPILHVLCELFHHTFGDLAVYLAHRVVGEGSGGDPREGGDSDRARFAFLDERTGEGVKGDAKMGVGVGVGAK